MKSDRSEILLMSWNPLLLHTRRLILGTYFDVEVAGRTSEAEVLLDSTTFALIILCDTLSDSDCLWVSEKVAQLRTAPKLLLLTSPVRERPSCIPGDRLPFIQGPMDLLLHCGAIFGRVIKGKANTMVEQRRPVTGDFQRIASDQPQQF